MGYVVKEVFATLQGEGANTGRAAVFCRFTGCNLACSWCDTDFVGTDGPGGGHFATAERLADHIESVWGPGDDDRFVVCTGGEPLLQLDVALIDALHTRGFQIAVETNGTQPAPPGLDWICVSPKAGAELVLTEGDELKVVFPQPGAEPERYTDLKFAHFFVQPMDGPDRAANTAAAVEYCRAHPQWRLSLQTHKYLGIP